MIRLEGVTIAFGPEVVLAGLELSIASGELVALIGPPGAGKSALLKALSGLAPATGAIEIDGQALAELDAPALRSLRQRIGMVFQNNALFDSLTIFDNVAYPLVRLGVDPSEIDRRVRARLADVGLGGTEAQFPHELSGGMQKRAGIARATVHSPKLRLYDEPTAGLDPVTAARILALIARLHAQTEGVSIIVSNEMDGLLKVAPRTVMLLGGKLEWDGPTQAIGEGRAPANVRSFVHGDVAFAGA